MSNNLSFKRKFFILKKEYSNMRNLNPKGHGKLELRNNRLNLWINIDNAEKDQFYNILLIGNNKVHELGKIHTDNSYSGKEAFDFNYKDIESIGFPLEKINGILILREKNILLGGYFDKADRTIENYIDKLDKEEVKKDIPTVAEVDNTLVEQEKVEQGPTQGDGPPVSYIINDLAETIEDDLPPVSPVSPASPAPPASPVSVTEEEYDKALQEMFNGPNIDFQEDEVEYVDVDTQRKLNQKKQTTNYVLNILNFFPYIEPFKINLTGYNWWKIEIDDHKEDKGFLPYFSYISGGNHKYPLVQNTVTATALMRKHGHYLFGLYNVNNEVKFYVYGVPGRFTKEDHPQRGSTGFNTWYEGQDDVGYWLLYIDPLTGRIIYPINPMIPKD